MQIVEFGKEPKKEKDPNKGIKFEKWIDSCNGIIDSAGREPSGFDFVMPIEKNGGNIYSGRGTGSVASAALVVS